MHGQNHIKFKSFIYTVMQSEPQDFQNQIHNISFQYLTAGDQEIIFWSVIYSRSLRTTWI